MIVIDTSAWFDLFSLDESRKKLARRFFRNVEDLDISVLEPKVFEIEFISLLSRRYGKNKAVEIFDTVRERIIVLPNPDKIAFNIALNTGCRAIDSYFIAITKLTNSILITNDKIMVENARKYGVEAYYLIEELDRVIKRLKEAE